jgi:hypothetical protein
MHSYSPTLRFIPVHDGGDSLTAVLSATNEVFVVKT